MNALLGRVVISFKSRMMFWFSETRKSMTFYVRVERKEVSPCGENAFTLL